MKQQFNTYNQYTEAYLLSYVKGQLTPAENHALEKEALNNPFLADAIDGYLLQMEHEDEQQKANITNDKPSGRIFSLNKKPKQLKAIAAAAGIFLVVGAMGYFIFGNKNNLPTTVKDNPTDNFTPLQKDSLAKSEALAIEEAKIVDTVLAKPMFRPSANKPMVIPGNGQVIDYAYEPTVKENPLPIVENNVTSGDQITQKAVGGADVKLPIEGNFDTTRNDDKGRDAGLKEVAKSNNSINNKPAAAPIAARKMIYDKNGTDTSIASNEIAANKPIVTAQAATTTTLQSNTINWQGANGNGNTIITDNNYNNSYLNTKPRLGDRFNNRQNGIINNNYSTQATTNFGTFANAPQNYRGRIVDFKRAPVPFAHISLPDKSIDTYADANGYYNFESIDTNLVLDIRAQGWAVNRLNIEPRKSNIIVLEDGEKEAEERSRNAIEAPKQADADGVKDFADGKTKAKALANAKRSNVEREYKQAKAIAYTKVYSIEEATFANIESKPVVSAALYETYLNNNSVFETTLRNLKRTKGTITVSFSVDKKGQPTNIVIVQGLSKPQNDDVIRLIQNGPLWSPTKNNKVVQLSIIAL